MAPEDRPGSEVVIDSYDGLVELFADMGVEPVSAIYMGFRFETAYRVPPRPRPGFISMEPETRGVYVTVHLGERVDANVDMRSRWGVEAGVEDLDGWYDVDATDEPRLREYLADGLDAALVALARGFDVSVSDDRVVFGPLLGTPAESAQAIDRLAQALPRPLVGAVPFVPAPCAGEPSGALSVIGWASTSRRAHSLRAALLAAGIPCKVDTLGDLGRAGLERRWHLLVPEACEQQAVKVLEEQGAFA